MSRKVQSSKEEIVFTNKIINMRLTEIVDTILNAIASDQLGLVRILIILLTTTMNNLHGSLGMICNIHRLIAW